MEKDIVSAENIPVLWDMLSDDEKAEVLLLNAVAKINKEQAPIKEVNK